MGFQLRGRMYEYGGQGTPHGLTERTVEIPVAMDFLRRRAPAGPALEVGNTLAQFLAATGEELPRVVLDRYERAPGVVVGDILEPPFAARFATIVCVSTVEHVGQRLDPRSAYGDAPGGLEPGGHAPAMLAIKRIHDLLTPGGEALITVPWGQAAEGGWQVVFGPDTIHELVGRGYVPAEQFDLRVLKRVGASRTGGSLWTEVDPASVDRVPYAAAQGHANAVAFISLRRSAAAPRPGPAAIPPLRAHGLRFPPGSQDERGATTGVIGLAAGMVEAGILTTPPLTAEVELVDVTTGEAIATGTLRSWERASVALAVPHPVPAALVRWRIDGEPPERQPDYVAIYRAGEASPLRVGIDMLGAQSPTSRNRGIGRALRGAVSALAAMSNGPELTLYWHPGMERAGDGFAPGARHVELSAAGPAGVQRVVDANPHALDVFIAGSPFETTNSYLPPLRRTQGSPAVVSIVYDLIPMVWSQERYLADGSERMRFESAARRLKRHDGLLAISDSARDDARAYLGMPPERVLAIGTGTDHAFWGAETGGRARSGGFLLAMCAPDPRKNADGLIGALAVLRDWGIRFPPLRMVMSGSEAARAATLATVAAFGLEDEVTLLQDVTDEELRALYGDAVALVFPSGYEGFGLPLAEAMSTSLPVVGVHNSSQPEVIGNAGITATSGVPIELARALAGVCDGSIDLRALGARGRERAATFTSEAVARRLVLALEALTTQPACVPHIPGDTNRTAVEVALAGPTPPDAGHIGQYTAALAPALLAHGRLSWWQTGRAIPLLEAGSPRPVPLPPAGRFGTTRTIIYEHIPGTAMPSSLASHAAGVPWVDLHEVPLAGDAERAEPPAWWPGRMPGHVLVHSHTLRDRLAASHPELAERIRVLPIGLPRGATPSQRDAARALRGFAAEDIVIGLPAETGPEAAVALVEAVAVQAPMPGGGMFRVLAEEPLRPELRAALHRLMRDPAARPAFAVLGLMSPAELRAARGATDAVLLTHTPGADELGLLRDHLATGAIPIAGLGTTHYGLELVGPGLLTDGSRPSLAAILARLAEPATLAALRDQATAWRARHSIEEVARCIHELIRAQAAPE
ncbi:MAG: glycosyltransferase [Dehalococcoidia bacterium]|nr:glycosyltransferase [Dehalococcoidia bacterium]